MRKLFTLFCAALLCACGMDALQDSPGTGKTVLSVSTPSTRTVLGDESAGTRQIFWSDGDRLAVNGTMSDELSGIAAGCTNAEFTFGETLSAPYDAVYPADIWKDASTVTLPLKAQNGVLSLGGRSDNSGLSLSPLVSCIHLIIKKQDAAEADSHQIAYVEISTESTRLSGDFTIDYGNAELTPAAGASANDCKVRVVGPWDLSTDVALDVFVPVPAGTYGFKVKVVDVKGHFMTVSTTSAKNMVKGVIKAFPEIIFVPTGTQFDVVIT